ncbi:MAG: site-2 protease family protein, partial [Phycisphaerales bacterium JB059]
MGWSDRDQAGGYDDARGGRFRAAMRRVFGDGENPLNWGFTLYRAWGIRVRVHLLFVIFLIARLIFTLPQDGIGRTYMLWLLAALFVLVLLHEYGHCVACRRVGGEADDIMLWPLGGLADCRPPHDWRASLITTLGGPLVNAALLLPLGMGVWIATRELGSVIFNPFDPGSTLLALRTPAPAGGIGAQPWWLTALWSAHYANLILLGFNLLVPMYPMDGARILHALLWRKMGHDRGTMVTLTVSTDEVRDGAQGGTRRRSQSSRDHAH